MPLLIIAIGVLALLVLTIRFKLNTFVSLIIVSIGVAMASGMPLHKIIGVVEGGFGSTLGHIGLIFGFGVMLGRLLAEAGGAQRIALTMLHFFGQKHMEWAVVCSAFIVGIALFFEVGLILLIPIIFAIAKEAKTSPMTLCVPMLAGLLVAHCFLPPHPGPTVIAKEYGADVGTVLIYGLIVGIPTFLLSGPILNRFCKKVILAAFKKAGDITAEVNSGETGYNVVVFLSRDDNHYNTVSVRHILIKAEASEDGTYTDEAKAAAKARAEEILAEFNSGDKTEDSFAALANEYSEDDGSNTNGGLYENIAKGQMVQEFNDFCFAGHKAGDTGIVYGDNGSYAGYHVMYFVGEGEQYSDYLAEQNLRSADMNAWIEELTSAYETSVGGGISFVGK